MNNPPPSPVNEPDIEPVICSAFNEPVIITDPVTDKELVTSTLPLINCEPVKKFEPVVANVDDYNPSNKFAFTACDAEP